MMVTLSFLLPCVPSAQASEHDCRERCVLISHLDRACFDELGDVDEDRLWDRVPCHVGWHAQVYVWRRQLVDVYPNIWGRKGASECTE